MTPAGTVLSYGQPAALPITYLDSQGIFTFSNLTATAGTEADWATLGQDAADAQGEVPWFVRVSIKQESGGDFTYSSVDSDLTAFSADGDYLSTVLPNNIDNALCPYNFPDSDYTIGSSYDACIVFSVNVGETLDSVKFEGSGYDLDTDPYYADPIVWRA